MRVGVFQFAPVFGDAAANLERIERALGAEQADLWVLPELATTGYQIRDRDEGRALAEPLADGPSSLRLRALSRRLGATIVCGLAERDGARLFNSALVVRDGEVVGVYRKSHLFEDEVDWSDPGDSGFRVFDVGDVRLGVMICFDWRFPEAARALALGGAQLIAHPCNLVRPQAPEVMKTRALENAVFAITCNRTGVEARKPGEALAFTGLSQIVSPAGELLFRMGVDEQGTRVVDLEPRASRDKRRGRNDLFADRRPELYGAITEPTPKPDAE
jgi:predicted amidohydrolase